MPRPPLATCRTWLKYVQFLLFFFLVLPQVEASLPKSATFGIQLSGQSSTPHRLIVLTDIEADPDDTQSLIRLLLYSNQMDIRGLIATTSCWMPSDIYPQSISRLIYAYGEVRDELLQHENGFPEAGTLLRLVKNGQPAYGMEAVGDDQDSEGSDWIIQELEREDERPLWISVWGGVNTLAQALYRLRATKSADELARLVAKLRVYTISDQDDSGIWIRNNFPELFYIVSPGDDYGNATWTGINRVIEGIDNTTVSNPWITEHLQQGHGPLAALYPDVSWGMEGDTPAFLSLIPNGLNQPEHPDWGGWGGRYEHYLPDFSQVKEGHSIVICQPETRPIWTNANDAYQPYLPRAYRRSVKKDTTTFTGFTETIWRWRDELQNDFAARMDWCILPYEQANHPPNPVLTHPEQLTLQSGENFRLDASPSTDPDGDNLSFLWFPYLEAGTFSGDFTLNAPENAHLVYGDAPQVEEEATIHIILRVTDKGSPALSRYKRVVLRVLPE
ncbi:MAG: nucleoside hydrolase-like domain-containing protein [Bacteroidota bacterium]